MLITVVTTNLVNLQRGHASADFLGYCVKHSCVDHAGTADSLYLLRSLNQLTVRHHCSFIFKVHDAFVKFCRLLTRTAAIPSFYHFSLLFRYSYPIGFYPATVNLGIGFCRHIAEFGTNPFALSHLELVTAVGIFLTIRTVGKVKF